METIFLQGLLFPKFIPKMTNMNKRKISKLMHERVGGLKSSGNYFFRDDFDYVLKGLVFEYVPRGLYIWRFTFPLFDFSGPHLTYSDRLRERRGFIGAGEMSEEEIVEFALSSPEAQRVFWARKSMDIDDFVRFLESDPGVLKNAHARLIHAAALVLTGKNTRADELLRDLLPALHRSDVADCELLRSSLAQGGDAAVELLERARKKNLEMLKILV